MTISNKWVKAQLVLVKPLFNSLKLESARQAQGLIGEIVARTHQSKVVFAPEVFKDFIAQWAVPKGFDLPGVILYLHGGGYVSGDVDYAKGFGAVLAAKSEVKVFCPAYRLAPEHPFPAALEDALEAYEYLLESGHRPKDIVLCGESAGGGLVYALCLKLKELGKELPAGIISISPWADLTLSGKTYETNADKDPLLTRERLENFAALYADDRDNPFVSPIFADLEGFPPSLLFAGGDEILLDDAVRLHNRLIAAGCRSKLTVTPCMWHAYIFYGVKAAEKDHAKINAFLKEVLE